MKRSATHVVIGALGLLVVGAGCSTESPADSGNNANNVILLPNQPIGGTSGAPITGGNTNTMMPAPTDGSALGGTGNLPCDVQSIVTTHCATCHGAVPQFGATFSLATYADFQKPAPSDPTRLLHQLVAERINLTDGRRMPQIPNPALSADELAIMNAWLSAGAFSNPTACVPAAGPGTGGTNDGTAGTGAMEPVVDDPSVTCYKFVSHAQGNMDAPFQVGTATDEYYNFTFNAPWTGTQYARRLTTVIDNSEVLHHWLFFKEPSAVQHGGVASSSGAHPGSELLHGWAPGGEDMVFAPDVGFEMPATGYTLELHYNSSDPSAHDSSGVEVCVTPNAPTNVASISWLGSDLINGTSATGTCTPSNPQRIHILGGTPHMHTHGTRMQVQIMRAAGAMETLHDEPFDFYNQVSYPKDVWLEPGDRVKTTCYYDAPVSFGEGTGDEMCYFFTLYYPKLSLTDAGFGSLIHGPNSCGVAGTGFGF